MDIQIDDISLLVTCDADVLWSDLEQYVNQSDLTLGFYGAQSSEVSIRDLLNKNPKNLFDQQYGSALDACVSMNLQGKDGRTYHLKTVPRTAAGPDFRRLLLLAGKRFGQMNQVTLRLHPLPERIEWHCSYWPILTDAKRYIEEITSLHMSIMFAQVIEDDKLPEGLQKEGLHLACIRFAGLDGLVQAYLDKASRLTQSHGGRVARVSKRKMQNLLEPLMGATTS